VWQAGALKAHNLSGSGTRLREGLVTCCRSLVTCCLSQAGALPLSYETVRKLHDDVLALEDLFAKGAEQMLSMDLAQVLASLIRSTFYIVIPSPGIPYHPTWLHTVAPYGISELGRDLFAKGAEQMLSMDLAQVPLPIVIDGRYVLIIDGRNVHNNRWTVRRRCQ